MNEVITKHAELLNTFTTERSRDRVSQLLLDVLLKDAVENKMRIMRAGSLYNKRAVEYYNKYETRGEF